MFPLDKESITVIIKTEQIDETITIMLDWNVTSDCKHSKLGILFHVTKKTTCGNTEIEITILPHGKPTLYDKINYKLNKFFDHLNKILE